MAIIDIGGVPHAYELTPPPDTPSTPVLVFIHGWLLSRQYWQPLIQKLAPHYQCLIYDLRGFGESKPTSFSNQRGYDLAAYAEDLEQLLQALDIHRAWLVGHSLGGSIALWGADISSHRVRGVICLNAGGGIYLKEEFERFRTMGKQLVKRRPRWLSYFPLLDLLFVRAMVARPLSRHWGRQRLIDFVGADASAALGALLDTTTEKEVHLLPQIVARLKQPVYFLAGAKDKIMEPKYVQHLASFHHLFKNGGNNVIEIPDCGHLSMVEQPEIVAEEMSSILSHHPPSPTSSQQTQKRKTRKGYNST
ncbi:alpha/beta fold hydrolase [Lusitaniella coriacea]|uniref:alpha/beta fold hydrolase n=1 Tax=Lusitaniella coriacea TaxID=1983105 RepID=UPI003CF48C09